MFFNVVPHTYLHLVEFWDKGSTLSTFVTLGVANE